MVDLFHAALERDPAERDAFLEAQCGGDRALRSEVESLLASHGEAETFLEAPAYAVAPGLVTEIDEIPSGRQIGPYRIVRRIGRGGMGIVYMAHDERLHRPVALKALAPAFTRDPKRRERLRREAQLAAALSHPNIATVYALEEDGDDLFIVSEYLEGQTLRELLTDERPLPIEQTITTAVAVARGLAAAHERGVIHRDLKPDNVFVVNGGQIKILDFGLARLEHGTSNASGVYVTEAGTILGTPAYMSPEQLRGRELDFRTDLFSFGATLYELATGRQPFGAGDTPSAVVRVLESDPPDVLLLNPAVPESLQRIIYCCLEKDPVRRYGSTRALLNDLEALHDAHGSAPRAALASAAGDSSSALTAREARAVRWWQMHQQIAALVVCVMLVPVWLVKHWVSGRVTGTVFYAALVLATVTVALRLHLAFASSVYPAELSRERKRSRPFVVASEIAVAVLCLVAAWLLDGSHDATGIWLIAGAAGLVVALAAIEPATTRAAFGSNEPAN